MRKISLFLLLPIIIACTSGAGMNQSAKDQFMRNQVIENSVLSRFVLQPSVKFEQRFTLEPFKLTERELLTFQTDLNSDGKMDIIGSLDNIKFKDSNGYPIYIIIADEYSYHQIPTDIRTEKFNLKVLSSKSNGFHDISVDGKVIAYDHSVYK